MEAFHNDEEENHDYEIVYEGESEEEAESFMLL